jgi:molecular chaperone DnaJ
MDLKEAFDILGLPKKSSAEELKAKYKELARKYHPDVYKDDPNKFSKINEAYQTIQDYQKDPDKYDHPGSFRRSPFENMGGIWNSINIEDLLGTSQSTQKQFQYNQINERVIISFKDSVLGVDKELSFKKYIKCDSCNGNGQETVGNGCQNCGGFGRCTTNSKGMIFTTSCNKCYGRNIKFKDCEKCNRLGVSEVNANITIHIPAGTQNNSTLRLRNAGHFTGSSPFGDAYTDVFVFVNVDPEPGLTIEGNDVLTNLKLSLLDAITGCTKEVKTIFDTRQITIPPKSKNKDEIHIQGCGVKGGFGITGVERVILEVEYPENTDKLVKILKGN